MIRTIATRVLVVACTIAFSATAQAQQATQAEEQEVTLTGCLHPGDEAGLFVLTDIERAVPPEVVGTTGTDDVERVHLTPAAEVDMQAHVRHKVEVTGTLTDAPVDEPETVQVEVTSFRHMDAACP